MINHPIRHHPQSLLHHLHPHLHLVRKEKQVTCMHRINMIKVLLISISQFSEKKTLKRTSRSS